MAFYPEKRQHRRIKISWPTTVITPYGPVGGRTQNLSPGGAFIRCREVPELEEIFRLVLRPSDRQLFVATVEKVWSDTFIDEKYTFHGIGLHFIHLPKDEHLYISHKISEHIKTKQEKEIL